MTFLPYASSPEIPPSRSFPLATLIAWLLIIASAAAIIVHPRWMSRSPNGTDVASLPAIAKTPSTQLQMVSRLLLGAKAFAPGGKPDPAMARQLQAAVTNPIDEFRAIIIIDELLGDQAALDRLDEFERKNKVVRLREDVDALRILYTSGLDHLTPHQTGLLVERHHWFGDVAVSHGLPDSDPRRQAALRPAGRAVLIGGAGVLLGLLMLAAGVALAVFGIVFWMQGKMHRAYQPPAATLASPYVEAFALYLSGMVGVSLILSWLVKGNALWVSFFLFGLLPLAMLYLRFRGVSWIEMKRDLGWHAGRGFWREVGAGLIGYIAGLPVLAIGLVITYFLMRFTGKSASHPIANEPIEGAIDVLQLVLLACVGAPIIEETMFRGALLSHLRARLGWWISAPIVSLIFAAIHPQGWVAIPVLGSIAMVLAGMREWRGSLVPSMTAHAINNGLAVLMLVAMTA